MSRASGRESIWRYKASTSRSTAVFPPRRSKCVARDAFKPGSLIGVFMAAPMQYPNQACKQANATEIVRNERGHSFIHDDFRGNCREADNAGFDCQEAPKVRRSALYKQLGRFRNGMARKLHLRPSADTSPADA